MLITCCRESQSWQTRHAMTATGSSEAGDWPSLPETCRHSMVTTRSGASPCSMWCPRCDEEPPSLSPSEAAAPPDAAAAAEGGEIACVAASEVKDRMLCQGQQISAAAQPCPRRRRLGT